MVDSELTTTQVAPSPAEATAAPSGCQSSARALCALTCACVRTIFPNPALQGSHCRSAGCTTSHWSRRCIAWLRRCAMVASRLHRTSGCPAFFFCTLWLHHFTTGDSAYAVVRVTTADSAYAVVRSSRTCGCLLTRPPFRQKFVLLLANSRLAGSSGSHAADKSRWSVPVRMCVPARTKRHNWADFMFE